jgi:AraC-like DNA-binding protein
MSKHYSDTVAQAIEGARQRSAAAHAKLPSAPSAGIIHHRFSVLSEPTHLQAAAWGDYVGRFLQMPLSRGQVARGFHGELDTWVLSDMIFLESRTDPVVHSRTLAKISRDNMRDFVFHVAVEGIIETALAGLPPAKALQFVPGILALDLNQPMRMIRPSWARVLAFFLPRAMVEAVVPDAARLHGCVVGYNTPLNRPLTKQLQALCQRLPTLGSPDSEALVRSCAQLIVAAFARQAGIGGSDRLLTRAAILDQVQRHVQDNLHSGDLSPDSVLRTFAVSRPTLYRMFEPEGGLAAYIRNCRLREAANELVDSPARPVMEIADDLHFGSHSDFARAFRRDYGRTPQEFRALGRDMLRS